MPSPASAPEAAPAAPAAREDALFSDMARELSKPLSSARPRLRPQDARSARVTPSPDAPVDTRGDDAPAPEAPVFISSEPPAFPARTAPPVAEAPRRQSEDAFSIEQAFAEAVPRQARGGPPGLQLTGLLSTTLLLSSPLFAESPLAEVLLLSPLLPNLRPPGPRLRSRHPKPRRSPGSGSDDHAPAGSPHAPAPGMTPAPTYRSGAILPPPSKRARNRRPLHALMCRRIRNDPDPRFPETEEPAASPAFAQAQAIIAEEALAEAAGSRGRAGRCRAYACALRR